MMRKISVLLMAILVLALMSGVASAGVEFSGVVSTWMFFTPNQAPQGYIWPAINMSYKGMSGKVDGSLDVKVDNPSLVYGSPAVTTGVLVTGGYLRSRAALWEGGLMALTTLGSISFDYSPYIASYLYDRNNVNNLKGLSIEDVKIFKKKVKVNAFCAFEPAASDPGSYVYGAKVSGKIGMIDLSLSNISRRKVTDYTTGAKDVLELTNALEASSQVGDKSKVSLVYVSSDKLGMETANAVKVNAESALVKDVVMKYEFYDVKPGYDPKYRQRDSAGTALDTFAAVASQKGMNVSAETKFKGIDCSVAIGKKWDYLDPVAGESTSLAVSGSTKILGGDMKLELNDTDRMRSPSITKLSLTYTLADKVYKSGKLTGSMSAMVSDEFITSIKKWVQANIGWSFTSGLLKGLDVKVTRTQESLKGSGVAYTVSYTTPGGIVAYYRYNDNPSVFPIYGWPGENVTAIGAQYNF